MRKGRSGSMTQASVSDASKPSFAWLSASSLSSIPVCDLTLTSLVGWVRRRRLEPKVTSVVVLEEEQEAEGVTEHSERLIRRSS
eukprot:537489-Rhodomonas_salina.1